jgi:2-amino-4-hydroxy-6-hydroxymethyldihydropteridine diphosphokinase
MGSNLGDRAGNLLLAVRCMLEASFVVHKLSAVYETDPVEVEGHSSFLNMAAEVRVHNISPTQMMARMLRIEYVLGRKEKSLKLPRTIDLDLLFYGNVRMNTPFLTLPHPRLHLRRFVLVPMAEIAPDLVHPGSRRSMRQLLGSTDDLSRVSRWHPDLQTREPAPVNS